MVRKSSLGVDSAAKVKESQRPTIKGTESRHPGDFLPCSLRGRWVLALLLLSGCFCCSLGCSDGCPCCLPLCELGLDKGDEGRGEGRHLQEMGVSGMGEGSAQRGVAGRRL